MVGREEATGIADGVQDALHAGVVSAAKVHPAADAPDVGVAPGGRYLFARDEERLASVAAGDLLEVRAGVVVGDRQEVEADAAGFPDVLAYRVIAIAVDGVGMEIAAIPA